MSTQSGNGHLPIQQPEDVLCVEYHNYLGGRPEIFLVTPDGHGISLPAEYLQLLRKSLETLSLVLAGTERGETSYVTIDSEGRVEIEKGKQ